MSSTTKPEHLPALDGLRGLACLMVLIAHTTAVVAYHWHALGTDAVYVFFAMSGFLITRILLDNRERGTGWRHFYLRRAARIFPVFYAVAAVCWLVLPGANFWHAALYVNNYTEHYQPLAHTWSLAFEEQFYLAWPLLVLFAPRKFSEAFAWGVVVLWLTGVMILDGLRWPLFYLANPANVMLLAGCVIAFHESAIRTHMRQVIAVAFGAVGAILWWWAFGRYVALHMGSPAVTGETLIHVVGPLLVFLIALGGLRWLAFKPLRGLGSISYGLYMIHFPIFWGLGVYLGHANLQTILAAWAVSLGLAIVSFRWFERPIMGAAKRWADKSQRLLGS